MAVQNVEPSSGTLHASAGSSAGQQWRAIHPNWPIGQTSAPATPRKYITHCKYCGAHRSKSGYTEGSCEFQCGTYSYIIAGKRKYSRSTVCTEVQDLRQANCDYKDQIERLQVQLMMREHDISVMLAVITGMKNARDGCEA